MVHAVCRREASALGLRNRGGHGVGEVRTGGARDYEMYDTGWIIVVVGGAQRRKGAKAQKHKRAPGPLRWLASAGNLTRQGLLSVVRRGDGDRLDGRR